VPHSSRVPPLATAKGKAATVLTAISNYEESIQCPNTSNSTKRYMNGYMRAVVSSGQQTLGPRSWR
jgi:hypothetical protein